MHHLQGGAAVTDILAPEALSIEEYHRAAPAWFSKTTLRMFAEMGAPWFRLWLDKEVAAPVPKGVKQGIALDTLLTEGLAAFNERVVFSPPDYDGRKTARKEWAANNASKIILPDEDRIVLADAADAVRRCSAWPAIKKSLAQHSIRRHDAGLGFGLQSRPDWYFPSENVVFDLKKTADLSGFGAQAINLGYHLQAAVARWCLGCDDLRAFLVAVEWERGARCRVYEIPPDVLAHADREMRKIALEISRRMKENNWTDHQPEAEMLPVPEWMQRRMAQ
jgi:hypothetical protein